jgi:hypothetical protein
MTSRALVDGCRFAACRDKGLSIGERSEAVVLRARIEGCGRGFEVKDASVVAALHCEITGCATALAAAKKDWRYGGGGRLVVHRSVLQNNASLAAVDTASGVSLGDCQLDPYPEPAVGVVLESCDGRASGGTGPIPFPLEAARQPTWAAAWAAACSASRGAGPRLR